MADWVEPPSQAERSPTPELLQRTAADLRELVQIEIDLAKNDASTAFRNAKTAAITLFIASGLGLTAVNLLLFSLFLALGIPVLLGVIVGLVLALAALAFAVRARAIFPKTILADTRRRLSEDVNRLKEHAA